MPYAWQNSRFFRTAGMRGASPAMQSQSPRARLIVDLIIKGGRSNSAHGNPGDASAQPTSSGLRFRGSSESIQAGVVLMGLIDRLFIRFVLWFGLPFLFVLLVVGPRKVWRAVKFSWHWLFQKRLKPEDLLAQVMQQHQDHVAAVRQALVRAESAEAELQKNLRKSLENVAALEAEASEQAAGQDDLGAKAALYKLNLERMAIDNFQEQLTRQQKLIAETRRRLYQLELQVRQYEVGRSILLSQLAEADTVEQQFAIANQFDPFNAVADWKKAEGLVQEKAITARAMERVYTDTADLSEVANPPAVSAKVLDAQLAELRSKVTPHRFPEPESKSEPAANVPNNHQPPKNKVEERSP